MSLISEVATAAGVSPATVSRVLNPRNSHPVGAETRARVLKAAQAVDFRPNELARGLRSRRARTISLIVHDVRDPYFNECARGASDAALEAGYLTVICNTDRDPATELRYVRMLRESRVSGILFIGGGLENSGYRKDVGTEVAAIRGYGGDVVALGPRPDRWPAEVPDNKGGARLATAHLIELGHTGIACIDGPPGLFTSRERLTGYREALEEAGIGFDPDLVLTGHFHPEGGARATAALLRVGKKFTAVFATNDAMAIGCLQVLTESGLRVPEDVSLVGFDDIPVMRWLAPPLTTIGVPMRELGAAGVRRLLNIIEPADTARRNRRVQVHQVSLVERASTASQQRKKT